MRPARSLWTAAPALFLALLAARLLDPSRVLAVRDFATFHLPLRASLLRLLEAGAPEWNPWIGGGQPVLSDPSYSAFYPATWLGLLLPLGWGFSVAAALHLALAAAGGFVLARRLGARPAVAAFAAVAWSGSGALLSNFHAYTLLAGGAWIPWILVAVDSGERATEARARRRAGLWLALALALPLLNGEPVTVLCGGLAAGCFAVARSGGRERLKSLGRVASAALLAAALAGIQLVPAIARLADTRRAGGLSRDEALTWSMPPARAIELVEPRAFGDPMRMEDGLYFGWGIQDRDFPFLFSLYASLLALALASVALARWPIPRRGAWTLMAALGIVLALGRFTPIDPFLHDHVPPFSAVRYPEKFFLLTGLALAFAAALGLEHLLREREAGRFRAANLPLALGGLLAGAALALGTLALLVPGPLIDFWAAHAGFPLPRSAIAGLLEAEAPRTVALAVASLAALVALRSPKLSARTVAALLLTVLGFDLLRANGPLLRTARASHVTDPPPIARRLPEGTRTIWSAADLVRPAGLVRSGQAAGDAHLAKAIGSLDPWTGVLWGLGYPLAADYALTFTEPAERAREIARVLHSRRESDPFFRFLGAWGVTATVVARSEAELAAEARALGGEPLPVRVGPSPFALPSVRFVAAAKSLPDPDAAVGELVATGAHLDEEEIVIAAPWQGTRRFARGRLLAPPPELLDDVELAVESDGDALLVVATTWDVYWQARVDDAPVPVLETAAGYLALPVPAGARTVHLVYRDPWFRVGAATSALAFGFLLLLALRRRVQDDSASAA